MSFLAGFDITASGLTAQRSRLNVTASNLANAETTKTDGGGPYLRRQVTFQANRTRFAGELGQAMQRVDVTGVAEDNQTPTRMVHDPGHPHARPDGYVEMPNVNVVEEMTEMVTASRSYEANATAFETLKKMALRALSIG